MTPPDGNLPEPLLHWRAHHILLCSSTYLGKGYTPAYTANLDAMMARINAAPEGVRVKLVDGPDDWCKPLLQGKDDASKAHQQHCLHPSTTQRDARARADLAPFLGYAPQAGSIITLNADLVREFRKAFWRATHAKQTGKTKEYTAPRSGCHACSWSGLCDEVARRVYPEVKLLPQAVPSKVFPIVLATESTIR